jgi:serine/threonine protein kinase/tetratricopeptide (TPR) repeat protein
MGEVYRARDTRLGRDVAIKVLPQHLSSDARSLARFEQEARAVATLSHPNVLAIHDVGETEGTRYAVMELLEGSTLRERLTAAEVSVPRAVSWALQIAQGLAAAHERDIVHRDLKPENVFVTRDGIVKILDFGLAQRVEAAPAIRGRPNLTATGMIVGTVGYLSPEQACGLPADQRSDIFAFGALLYEIVTGRRAFDRPSSAETIAAVVRDEPPPISDSGRKVSNELEEIIRHCLEKDPGERFRTARDLVFALRLVERALSRPPSIDTEVRAPAPARSPEPSIAVMLFRTVGGNAESEYFAEGMTEDVIAALSSVPGLRVAARTSSFAFRGKNDDVRKIGSELGVATVLDGSVRQAGQRLRVTAQLIDVASGYNLWSERWDRDMADVFAVQEELASAIARTLRAHLPGSSTPSSDDIQKPAKVAARENRDVAAYDRYLKGRYFMSRRRLHEAIGEFEAALQRDPDFFEAHTALSSAWSFWGFYGGVSTWECWARARAAAERAEELAPDSAAVPLGLGIIEHYYGWNSANEERFFRLALARDPTNAEVHFWLALCIGALGRVEEALVFAREGVRLEPHSPNNRAAMGWPLLTVGRYEEAAQEFAAAVVLGESPFALWSHGTALSALGRHEPAIAALSAAVEATGGRYSYYSALLANALAQAGRTEEARRMLRELEASSTREYLPQFDRALVLVGLGEDDAALTALERACYERNAFIWSRMHYPQFQRLAKTPRFRALAEQLAVRAPVKWS